MEGKACAGMLDCFGEIFCMSMMTKQCTEVGSYFPPKSRTTGTVLKIEDD